MNDICTTLLNSPVIASIIEALLVCFVISRLQKKNNKELEEEKALIQHDCDIRLERYRVEFNQILSEHQTSFTIWHQEKADATKIIYKELTELYYLLQRLLEMGKKKIEHHCSEKEFNEFADTVVAQGRQCNKAWMFLRLYIDKKEDDLFCDFLSKVHDYLILYISSVEKSDINSLTNDGEKFISQMAYILNLLRESFRENLSAQRNSHLNKRQKCTEKTNDQMVEKGQKTQ